MKFQPELPAGGNFVTRHEAGRIWIGSTAYAHSLLLPWQGEPRRWQAANFAALQPAHFEAVLEWQPELVLFGSGAVLRFAAPALWQALMQRRIGFETMDTAAACRTFNVLASEHRRVVAALLPGAGP